GSRRWRWSRGWASRSARAGAPSGPASSPRSSRRRGTMLQKIRIKLKSYDHATLDQSASDIVRAARRTGAVTSGPVPLPTKKTVYTVLRSPHVDKKSREQFEIRIHKRLIDITRSTAQTMEALEKLDIPAGVDIEIKTSETKP